MNTIAQTQDNQTDNVSISLAVLTNSSVNDFYFLHEQVRLKTGTNLKKQTPDNIHHLIAHEAMLGAWMNTDHLAGMFSVRPLDVDDYALSKHFLVDRLSGFTGQSTKRTAYFNSFAVSENAQGMGVGKKLLLAGLDHAQTKMITKKGKPFQFAFARVAKHNLAGLNIFKKVGGFKEYGEIARKEDGTPLLVLAREL